MNNIIIGLEMVGGEHTPYFKIGSQTFFIQGDEDPEDARWSLEQLRAAFAQIKPPLNIVQIDYPHLDITTP